MGKPLQKYPCAPIIQTICWYNRRYEDINTFAHYEIQLEIASPYMPEMQSGQSTLHRAFSSGGRTGIQHHRYLIQAIYKRLALIRIKARAKRRSGHSSQATTLVSFPSGIPSGVYEECWSCLWIGLVFLRSSNRSVDRCSMSIGKNRFAVTMKTLQCAPALGKLCKLRIPYSEFRENALWHQAWQRRKEQHRRRLACRQLRACSTSLPKAKNIM